MNCLSTCQIYAFVNIDTLV